MDNLKGTSPSPETLMFMCFNICHVIRKFKAHGTVANLPGRGRKRKLDQRLQQRIIWMVEKAPPSTAKQIQADLQTQGTRVSTRTICRQLNERGFYGRRPRRTPLETEGERDIRKPDWSQIMILGLVQCKQNGPNDLLLWQSNLWVSKCISPSAFGSRADLVRL